MSAKTLAFAAFLAVAAMTKPSNASFKRALAKLVAGRAAGGGVRGFLSRAGLSVAGTLEDLLGARDHEKVIRYTDLFVLAHVEMDRDMLEAMEAGMDARCWQHFVGIFGYWLALKHVGDGRGFAGSDFAVAFASAQEE